MLVSAWSIVSLSTRLDLIMNPFLNSKSGELYSGESTPVNGLSVLNTIEVPKIAVILSKV